MRRVDFLIAGAGPCGLGAALELEAQGRNSASDYLIVDARPAAGGWAASCTTPEGFTFDHGGHVLFPHKNYAGFAKLLDSLPLEWVASVPKRGVNLNGRFLPYPAQRNLQRLPLGKLLRALGSLALRRLGSAKDEEERLHKADLESYLKGQFGHYLTRTLMEPLNSKMWAHAAHRLSKGWVTMKSGSAQRNVPDVSLRQTLRNVLTMKDTPGWTPDTFVPYPAQGGAGALWVAIGDKVPAERMLLGRRIQAVDPVRHIATLDDGEEIVYGQMISSMPLDTLLRSLEGTPELLKRAAGLANRFVFARSRLFGFGIKGRLGAQFEGLHSFHVPAPEIPFWRLTFPSNMSAGNVPPVDGGAVHYSVLVEISEPATRKAEPEKDLQRRVIEGLRALGVLEEGQEVVSVWATTVEHGYPVPFLGRDELLAEVTALLEPAGIWGRGRFGAWRYEISNQDHAFMQGTELVRRLVLGIPEETYTNPVAVNETAEPVAELVPAGAVDGELEAVSGQ